ncbi:DEAD/DEAH box helicase [Ruania alba]|uniref:Helicase conserved C-terminal domain-containing protein n=1 Tax=Ruania alba TaxID=648782 RepID=A0A1H5HWB6_9MICO|nr:DEAD/DEAH box helicase [Ruania alba]SEE32185.1 Helicase conserved C-terminal domain-containing protein [Ruania alba]
MTLTLPTDPTDDDALVETFTEWAAERGLPLYPHQEEALLELVTGAHVICSTPTGSGKSLIAVAAHYVALARGIRTVYTAPLKALVSEKFFDLVEIFGADQVGMVTGDSSINADAPIVCCTAEILANRALRTGEDTDAGQVVMDEFHFYADPQRGWAWQVPLLELTSAQFLLMSATLGDVSFFAEDLTRRTGAPVAVIANTERPVPLTFTYSVEPLNELITELLGTHRTPAYLVHFTQAAAVAQAQALTSVAVASKAQKARIAEALGDVSFAKGFGSTLSRLLRSGIGVHHAGMLPRYRRLVERLAQAGLLPVICGTDTLGVGINVPIRTVVLTGLTKFDGVRARHLSAREMHQIAGRAGRAGFDTIGEVIVQAPEHVIENAKSLAKAGDDVKKKRKIVRKKAPAGVVNWTDKTFERLRDADPEPLTSQFSVSHAMVLGVLAREGDPLAAMRRLLVENHDAPTERNPHVRRAISIYRTLRQAGLVERVDGADGPMVRLVGEVPDDFALNAPLSPFALAALELLDQEHPDFALDVVSVIEATLEDPRPVLIAQEKAARGEAVAAMKAEGMDYPDRMDALEEVTYPRPLAELLTAALAEFRTTNPWVDDYELKPKSVVRDMAEHAMTFSELISRYQLARSEGVVLRYLTDAYKALRQVVPATMRTEELAELIEWLGTAVRQVDSSLLAEWEALQQGLTPDPDVTPDGEATEGEEARFGPGPDAPITANPRTFRALVRNAVFHRVELAAREAYDSLGALDGAAGWTASRWAEAMDGYWDEYDHLGIGPEARSGSMVRITAGDQEWQVEQVLDDPEGDRDWRLRVRVDLAASAEAGRVVLTELELGPATAQG